MLLLEKRIYSFTPALPLPAPKDLVLQPPQVLQTGDQGIPGDLFGVCQGTGDHLPSCFHPLYGFWRNPLDWWKPQRD